MQQGNLQTHIQRTRGVFQAELAGTQTEGDTGSARTSVAYGNGSCSKEEQTSGENANS